MLKGEEAGGQYERQCKNTRRKGESDRAELKQVRGEWVGRAGGKREKSRSEMG